MSVDKPDRNRGTTRYTSTNQLLTFYSEDLESAVNFTRMPAALDLRVGMIGATTDLDVAMDKAVYLHITCRQSLLKDVIILNSPDTMSLKAGRVEAHGYVLNSASVVLYRFVCQASHIHVHYSMYEK